MNDWGDRLNASAASLQGTLRESDTRLVLAESCTAGLAAAALGSQPGVSAHFCGSAVTYRNETKACWLGISRELLECPGPVSPEVAAQMATGVLGQTPEATLGLAVTGHLGPDAPAGLDGQIYVAAASRASVGPATVGVRAIRLRSAGRVHRQREAATWLLALAERAAGVARAWRDVETSARAARRLTGLVADGPAPPAGGPPRLVFPGAFNPLHEGHQQMLRVAQQWAGGQVELELSVRNVDKSPLDAAECMRRALAIDPPLWLTNAPTFADKGPLFPGCTFLVGADTVLRLADLRYYGHDPEQRAAAWATLARYDCRFLVFGRLLQGSFVTLEQLEIPSSLRALCEGVPAEAFRVDLASSQLRPSTEV